MTWSRRRFLTAIGAAGATTAAGCRSGGDGPAATTTTQPPADPPTTLAPVDPGPPVGEDPFDLGVASGDPDHTSVVVWTHLARAPIGPAITTESAGPQVLVEIGVDAAMAGIVQRIPATVDPEADRTVRLVVEGLAPDTAHWYRFVVDGHTTTPARTRTAPAPGTQPSAPLRLAHLSCQRYSSGYWTALADVAEQLPDLVVHCGDYVYESDRGEVRPLDLGEATDLEGYRTRYRRYRAEPELQAAHAVAPWLQVWDDHEVVNDYAGSAGASDARRAAAYRAWWEHTPTRLPPPDGPSLPIHRRVDWGALTRFVLLDGRQFRDPQVCATDSDLLPGNVGPRCEGSDALSMLGADQEAWFAQTAPGHDATWTTVVNQTVVHQWRIVPGNVAWNLDQWDGYPAARRRLLDVLADAPTPVVLTGDVHSSWVADLRTDFDDDDSPVVGVELVTPGISSAAPDILSAAGVLIERLSPHIAWSERTRRGWVLHTVDDSSWVATFRLVDDVSEPGGTVEEATTWTLEAGRPGLA